LRSLHHWYDVLESCQNGPPWHPVLLIIRPLPGYPTNYKNSMWRKIRESSQENARCDSSGKKTKTLVQIIFEVANSISHNSHQWQGLDRKFGSPSRVNKGRDQHISYTVWL